MDLPSGGRELDSVPSGPDLADDVRDRRAHRPSSRLQRVTQDDRDAGEIELRSHGRIIERAARECIAPAQVTRTSLRSCNEPLTRCRPARGILLRVALTAG